MSYTILHIQDGSSPLSIACQENRSEIVDHLLKAKADINLQHEVKEQLDQAVQLIFVQLQHL